MKIYFVRHGESELNIGNREQGAGGSLSDLGRRQAEFVSKRFTNIPIDIVVTSPYPRAKETAGIISSRIKTEFVDSEFLTERRPPTKFIGVKNDDPEYQEVKRVMQEKRLLDPAWKYEDEDTFIDLRDRAQNALEYLKGLDKEHILAVTHAGILRVIVGVVIFGDEFTYREHLKFLRALKADNTAITVAEYKDGTSPDHSGWRLRAWNDHAHLAELN